MLPYGTLQGRIIWYLIFLINIRPRQAICSPSLAWFSPLLELILHPNFPIVNLLIILFVIIILILIINYPESMISYSKSSPPSHPSICRQDIVSRLWRERLCPGYHHLWYVLTIYDECFQFWLLYISKTCIIGGFLEDIIQKNIYSGMFFVVN